MRSALWVAAVAVVASACGGRVVGEGQASDIGNAVLDGGAEAGSVAGIAPKDSGAVGVDAAEEPTAEAGAPGCLADENGGGFYCPAHEYCVVWLAADAGGFDGGRNPPSTGVVEAQCQGGSPQTVCDGGVPAYVGFSTYANAISWAGCVEP